MNSWSQYATYYKRRPTGELQEISSEKELYHDEARMAALAELKKRGIEISEAQHKELEELTQKIEVKEKQEKLARAKSSANEDEVLPEYYSPAAILGFSIFFSVIFGGVLMFQNLRKAGKKTEASVVLVISVLLVALSAFVAKMYQVNQWIALLINVSGALILIEYFWKKYLGYHTKFIRKPLTTAILVSIGISLVIFAIIYVFFKDQLPPV